MKNRLGITEGEWTFQRNKKNEYGVFGIEIDSLEIHLSSFVTIWGNKKGIDKEAKSNAKLISDAGTTANKCGLLPSELLEQRNELLEALKELYLSLPDGYKSECLPKVRKAINKATKIN